MGCQPGVEADAIQSPRGSRSLRVAIADVDGGIAADDTHPAQGQGIAAPGGIGQAEEMELFRDSRTGVLGASLGTRMRAGLDQQHVSSPCRERGSDCRPGRPGADDQHLAVSEGSAHA